jgi:Tfp pilus assembly protein PilF
VEIYRNQKRPDLEEKELREAVAADPANSAAFESLGRFLLAAKKMDQAEQVYMQMLTSRADPAIALSGLGDVHAAQGKRDQAAEDYRQAISRSIDPKATQNLEKKLRAVGGKK